MDQAELSAEAAEGKGTDPFARARAAYPNDRLMLALDRRDGSRTLFRVEPSSAWYPLLPPEQIFEIHPTDGTGPGA